MRKILLSILFCLVPVLGWGFPTTGTKDNFTRANSSTTLGSNWTTDPSPLNSFGILSNNAYVPSISDGAAGDWWSANTFGNNQEVWAVIVTVASGLYFFARVAHINAVSGMNGYGVEITATQVKTLLLTNDNPGTTLGTYTQTVSNGDSVGLSVIGSKITAWYKSGNGSWTSLGSVTDTTYTTGSYIGMIATNITPTLLSFGGGQSAQAGFNFGF